MQPTRLRALLIGVLLGVQLVTAVAVVSSLRGDATDALEATAGQTLERFSERAEESTRRHLDGAEDVLSAGTRLIDAGLLDAGDDDALRRYLTVELQSYPWISGMVLGRADGSMVLVSRGGEGLRTTILKSVAERRATAAARHAAPSGRQAPGARSGIDDAFDPRERPWYRAARTSDGHVWTDPYVFQGLAVPGVSVAAAVERPAGSPTSALDRGVLAVSLDLRVLSMFLAAVPEADEGSAALVNSAGRVIAYSDAERYATAIDEDGVPVPADLDDVPLARLLERHGSRVAASGRAPIDLEPLRVDGRRHLAVVRPFSTEGHSGPRRTDGTGGAWTMVAQVPFDRYVGAIDTRFVRKLAVLVVVLTLAAVGAVLRVTRPVYRIHRDATVDPLTGVCNRAEFEQRVQRRFGHERRDGDGTVLVAFDLDGFKAVNDTHGHAAGDAVLVAFARRLSKRLRSSDTVGRLGGDEFVLALGVNGASAGDAALVDGLRDNAVRERIAFGDERLAIGATAGLARHIPGESVAETLRRADRALVAGKMTAKNRTYVAAVPAGDSDPTGDDGPTLDRDPTLDRRIRGDAREAFGRGGGSSSDDADRATLAGGRDVRRIA